MLHVREGASRRGRMRQSRGTCGWARQGLRLGRGRGRCRRDPPAAATPSPRALLSQPPVLGSGAGAVGFWLGPARVGGAERLVPIPLASRVPWLFIPRALAFCSSLVLPRPAYSADRHMSSCYQPADTPGQLHVGVTRAEAPLPLYLESCSKSAPRFVVLYLLEQALCLWGSYLTSLSLR